VIPAIVVYVLIVTVPLLGAAGIMERAFRLWTWPVRGVWAATLLVTVLLGGRAVTHQLGPVQQVVQISTIRAGSDIGGHPASTVASARIIIDAVTSFPRSVASRVAHSVGPVQSRILLAVWCAMSVAMLTFICFVYARMWFERRRWGVTQFAGQRVQVSPHVGPAVVGLFRTEIVIPTWMLESGGEDGGLVVMHEMEHRNARDPLLLATMWALVALIPWHPGAWYCLARTRLAIELDCDARVLSRGAPLRTYAQLLLNQARVRLGAPMHLWLGATSLLEPSSHLERRLKAMILPVDLSKPTRPVARFLRTFSYFAAVAVVAITACESHVPTAADISGLDAASAETNARKVSIFNGAPVTFYVNDVRVSADSAHAIPAAAIVTVTVSKGATQQVRILTVPYAMRSAQSDTFHEKTDAGNTLSIDTRAPGDSGRHVVQLKRQSQPFAGAITIDGVAADLAAMNSLDPSRIATIDVTKGPTSMQQSTDPRARNGLIRITLKH
jgi:bla regulator protein blaR1